MKYIKISLSIFLLINMLMSCTEVIDIELDSTKQRIAIEANLSDELKQHEVRISKSSDYFQNYLPENISGALVTLNDGENTFSLQEFEPGIYKTDLMKGVPGKTYTLKVNVDNVEYVAMATMPNCPPLEDSIHIIENPFDNTQVDIQGSFTDPKDENNYYAILAYQDDMLVTDSLKEITISEDRLYDGIQFKNITLIGIDKLNYGDMVTLELQAITKTCYEYLFKIKMETQWNGGPFSGPPANINGNFSNNALGFFKVYAISRMPGIYHLRE